MLDVQGLVADKSFLRSLIEKNFELPNDIDTFRFALALLPNFASTDEELRDELSYMLLSRGILDRGLLTAEQLQQLAMILLDDEHLFYRVGEIDSDSVFMRSFSNLIIAALLYTEAKDPLLPAETVHEIKTALLRYARVEKDWRGHVEGKGWAHTMAHLADALDECAQHPSMQASEREEILDLVGALAQLPQPLYHEEDVRLAMVAYHIILGKQAGRDFLSTWIARCVVERTVDVSTWTSATNVKNFLRSLYFLMIWDNIAAGLAEQISDQLKRQDAMYLGRGDAQ
ncbi:MAG TPA: DUF2785 domain-containing protein [Ktedonobacteraceae bacterium]|jgi:hypothetical protein|nr:DUF2785 domain-containing protein [Ktedonobacteraceae bacterium]